MSVEISEEIRPFLPVMRDYARKGWSVISGQLALQKDRLFYWLPVFLSVGIGIYFSLRSEPPLFLGLVMTLCAGAALIVASEKRRVMCLALCLIALGFTVAQVRTALSYTPILQREISATVVSGRIEMIEEAEDGLGSRVLLSRLQIEKLKPSETPRKVRISVRKDDGLHVGQRVRMLAGLGPPSPPLAPGAFDFQRYMYFQGIGALGFAFQAPQIIGESGKSYNPIERLREIIDDKIAAVLPYPEAAIAMALTTGRRAAISQDANDAITAAGLAHILSISGLHIGLVSGILFFVTRLLMVCVPRFALRHPVKKYAAGFAFLGAVFYTLLAGAPIPAQRSLLMVGIALLAIVVDRSPLSMRLVAFAAFMVLLLAPESLMSASFQMSFAAVAGLVMVFDTLRPQMSEWYANAGFFKKAALYILSVCLTTVIASVATTPMTIFHFQQLTLYGVIGNALAVPLSAFLIMPAGTLALLAMPFGLEHWPLQLMGLGLDGMMDISIWVAGLPKALLKIPAPPTSVLPLLSGGIIFLFLIKGWLRVVAIIPIAAALILTATYRAPDILIDPSFELVSVYDGKDLYVSNLRKEKFIRGKWESLYGMEEGTALPWPKEGADGLLKCDELACRFEKNNHRVSILKLPGALAEECGWADVILAFDPLKGQSCAGKIVIDKYTVYDNGAQAFWLSQNGISVQAAEQIRGSRPWGSLNTRFNDKSASDSPAGPGF